MIEIRIHGRGGQGAVIASRIIAEAAFHDGKHVQAFPAFGSERRGAPVTAFVRIGTKPILVRSEVYAPDGLIVLDQSLITLGLVDITQGLKKDGWILINTTRKPDDFPKLMSFQAGTVDASGIAVRHGLGTATAPLVNTAMAGAFAAFTDVTSLANITRAIRTGVPVKVEENVAAAFDGAQSLYVLQLAS
jgi:2-oxoisovalerate/pyruvate ferredoxin oxidoreductase gamma subunit